MSHNYAVEKDWLLNASNLAVVRQCRRCIQDEFGVKLTLTQDDILRQIQVYAEKSNNPHLRRLARPVIALLIQEGVLNLPVPGADFEEHYREATRDQSFLSALRLVQ
jgi:hypothetical protein